VSLVDTNAVIRAYLVANAGIIAFFDPDAPRIYCPRLPEGAILPAIGFFTRGGRSTPYIPDLVSPSVQFDCWADSPIVARQVYRTLYGALQGLQNQVVDSNKILSAREEVQGQDLQDVDIPGYWRVLSFWEIIVR